MKHPGCKRGANLKQSAAKKWMSRRQRGNETWPLAWASALKWKSPGNIVLL